MSIVVIIITINAKKDKILLTSCKQNKQNKQKQ